MARLVFASDLHLPPRPSEEMTLLLRLLSDLKSRQASGQEQALYVVGDLFSFWIDRPLAARLYQPVLTALAELSRSGCQLTLLDGNRDFGFGRVLREATGARLAGERAVVEQSGRRAVLLHGDQLLTADRRYQLFKLAVRSWPARLAARWLPAPLLLRAVRRLEHLSAAEKSRKPPSAMRLDDTACAREAAAAGAELVIHGHTHCPGQFSCRSTDRPVEVYGLGAWGPEGATILEWSEGQPPHLVRWPPAPTE